MLRGKPGQPIKLVVRRSSTKEMLEMEIVREVMKESTIKDIMLLKPKLAGNYKIGYIRLLQFNAPTPRELADALDELEDRGMEAFILDLRNNPGGLLSSAIDVCGEFLPPNTTVLTTRGRVDSQNPPPYRTSETQRRERNYPVAILINQTSASGAEVVAGALQDLKRAVIVGETSFGKGSVQSIIPMGRDTGAAMRLTTAKYYTPSQKVIHENGVTPNIEIPLTPEEERDLARWRNRANLRPGRTTGTRALPRPPAGARRRCDERCPRLPEALGPQARETRGRSRPSRIRQLDSELDPAMPTILAIESSCDETAVAICDSDRPTSSPPRSPPRSTYTGHSAASSPSSPRATTSPPCARSILPRSRNVG